MSKSKSIGTRAETAVRNYLLSVGYSPLDAHRNVLKGSDDEGDVWLVTQRAGVGYPRAGDWWAYANLGDLIYLRTNLELTDKTLVRITLAELVKLIHG